MAGLVHPPGTLSPRKVKTLLTLLQNEPLDKLGKLWARSLRPGMSAEDFVGVTMEHLMHKEQYGACLQEDEEQLRKYCPYKWIQDLMPDGDAESQFGCSGLEDGHPPSITEKEDPALTMLPLKWVETITSVDQESTNKDARVFMTTFRAFMTPANLLSALVQRFFYPARSPKDLEALHSIRLKVLNILKIWTGDFETDFLASKSLRKLVEEFLHFIQSEYSRGVIRNLATSILCKLEKSVYPQKWTKVNPSDTPAPVAPNMMTSPSMLPSGGVSFDLFVTPSIPFLFGNGVDGFNAFYYISPVEIARQLTLVDFDLFKRIRSFEWLEKRFSHKNRKLLSPWICKMVDRFNILTSHVSYAVLAPKSPTARAVVLQHWIRIAASCHEMNNFSSLYSIFCGLNSTPVYRLKETWGLINKTFIEVFEVLAVLFAPQKNSINFRMSMQACPLPAIPHIGLLLKDLTFIEDGNQTVTDGGQVNLLKMKKVHAVIETARRYQRSVFAFPKVEAIQDFIKCFSLHERDALYDLSYVREPRTKRK